MKLSIVIVNFNTFDLTFRAISSILKTEQKFSFEIMLVDNASSDDSLQKLEKTFQRLILEGKIKIFTNSENLGFSKANNICICKAQGEYILLLNSDTKVLDNTLELCINRIEKENIEVLKVGALGCRLILEDGSLDHACKRGFPTPCASFFYFTRLDKLNPKRFGKYDALQLNEYQTGEVDAISGAFMLIPKKVLNEVGTLDESFFMYGEDLDLCFRIKKAGYKILYEPAGTVVHYKGGSGGENNIRVVNEFYNSMWLFYRKHYWHRYPKIAGFFVFFGIRINCFLNLIRCRINSKKSI